MSLGWVALAGFLAGFIAGFAARYGRLCTMGAAEAWIISRDGRALKAWGLALAIAAGTLAIAEAAGWIDLSTAVYRQPQIDLVALLLGGLLFGLGMASVGTCSFGVLVRAGGGDLRALVTAPLVGITAFAFTGGMLAPLRNLITGHAVVDLSAMGSGDLGTVVANYAGGDVSLWRFALAVLIAIGLIVIVSVDRGLRRHTRLLAAAVLLGAAIAAGWISTSMAMDRLELDRVESLTFVAPVGRLLLQVMIEPLRGAEFGIFAVLGVVVGSAAVAFARKDLRFEAFDDPREMRRHLFGAALMGLGGVLARGCSIGQGLSGGSTLALSMPLFIIATLIGAKIGLDYLIEGRLPWHRSDSQAHHDGKP